MFHIALMEKWQQCPATSENNAPNSNGDAQKDRHKRKNLISRDFLGE